MKAKSTKSYIFVTVVLLIITAVCMVPALGQETRATLRGTVTDSSKAALADAAVTVTDVAKGTSVTVKTNAAGLYVVPYLLPGKYTIAVEAPSFKKMVRQGIELQVGDVVAIDIELQLGPINETLTVIAETPLLSTSTASAGQVVDAKRIAELPIAYGDPYKLIGLAAGASRTGDPRLDRPFEPTHITGYTMDGTRGNRSDLTIDGAPTTARANRGEVIASYDPPQDVVQEFKVQTSTFDAQFGNTEGGVTALQTKSGTKNLHGTISYMNMPPPLFANDWYANHAGLPRADFYAHRFGGMVGGPVVIPKVYDGRKKTFFMFGMEGIKDSRPRNNGVFNTPTLCMLGRATCNGVQQLGNFSELLPLGANYLIYNPFSAAGTASAYQRTAFTSNIITPALINPVAKALADKYWPSPTSTNLAATDGTGNFQQPNMTENATYYSYTARLDQQINEAHRVFARLSWYSRNSDYNNYFHNIATGNLFQFVSRQGVADYVWAINSSMILNARFGYNRFIRGDGGNPGSLGFDLTSVGFPSSYAGLIPGGIVQFPRIRFGSSNIYQGTAMNGEWRPNEIYSPAATLTKIVGPHSLRAGAELRVYRQNDRFFANNQTGDFMFDNTYTQARNTAGTGNVGNSIQIGHAFAAFLLGVPASASISMPASYAEQSQTYGFFVQDDWQINRKLTVNIGLRYEFEKPLTERYNKTSRQFDINFVQPRQSDVQANYNAHPIPEIPVGSFSELGGITFVAVGGNPKGAYDTPKTNFMPRFGFAFSPDQKTVIRGGFGIFYGFLGVRQTDVNQPGFSSTTQMNITSNSGFSFNETLSNPFTAGLVLPTGSAAGGTTFLGQGLTAFDPKPKTPYNQRWELSVQREVKGGFVAEAAYVGNRGTHLEVSSGSYGASSPYTMPNVDVTPQKYFSTAPVRWGQAEVNYVYLTSNVTNPFRGGNCTTANPCMPSSAASAFTSANIAHERLLRPFPEFDTIRNFRYDGYSWYHGLQLSLQKRMARGYTVNVAYTFSKFMTANELLNDDDVRPEPVISDQDFPHRLSVSWIWELPFGKGRALAGGAHGFVNKVIGDWQLGGYYQFQSGNPLGAFGQRNYFGDLRSVVKPRANQSPDQWFDTTGFVALRNGATIITTDGTPFASGGTPIFVDFNDPCKNTYNASTCPGTPIQPKGWLRDGSMQPDHMVRGFPLRFPWLRSDWQNNWDMILIKNIPVNERCSFQFRAEFLNALNHVWFQQPNIDPTSGAFGSVVTSNSNQRNYPRRTQMGMKFIF